MKFIIETARDQHRVKDESGLRAKHEKFIAKQAASGIRGIRVHESDEPKTARINHGAWVCDCECGAGVAVDPDFSAAYCFGCGAVHKHVVLPPDEDRLNLEHVLLARRRTENRNWDPAESLIDVLVTNAEHGVKL
jgi:hypothetical protein